MRQMTKDLEEKPIEKTEVSNLDQVSMTRKERRKYRKEQIEETTKDMNGTNNTTSHIDLIGVYETLHPATAGNTLLSNAHSPR